MAQQDLPGIAGVPKTIRQSLLARSLFEFGSSLLGEARTYFVNSAYIDDLALERKRILGVFSTQSFRAMLFNLLLVGYVSGVRFDVSIFGNQITQFPAVIELGVLVSAFFLSGLVASGLDYMLAEQMLMELCGRQISYQSPRFVYAHKDATGLWMDVFTRRIHGYASGFAHQFVITFAQVYFNVSALTIYGFCYGAVVYSSVYVFSDDRPFGLFKSVVVVADIVATVAFGFFLVCAVVPFRFKIKDTGSQQ